MRIESHIEKIGRLNGLSARLDPHADFELWFWTILNVGTNAINAALHHSGVTSDDDVFPTQPGVYLVPTTEGLLEARLLPPGDVLHVNRPRIDAPVPADVAEMMEAMMIIEHHRDPCVREDYPISSLIIDECESALAAVLNLLQKRIK